MQLACGAGHMTLPNAVALLMHHTSLGHDALFVAVAAAAAACFAIILAVDRHLRRHFCPARGSLREAQLLADHEKV